ncbi:mitochondrial import inner membrane translocase subunit Tim8-like [Macrobrachium nipponense]|uniref:mitochondrial import inner membrane translocase subunit Tim8-like n=1 Tax=Macrobrachium nipponense TaxID=159736 RepID=UPI0030C7CD6B
MGWLFGGGSEDTKDSSSSSSSYSSGYSSGSDYSSSSFDTGSSSSSSYADSFGSSSLGGGLDSSSDLGGVETGDSELKSFLMLEQQKAQMQTMIHKMNDICWETCMGTPGSKLDSRTETCISNCVDRFIDSTLFITNRFAQLLSKQGGMM